MQPETRAHFESVESTLGHLVRYIEPNRDWCVACREAEDNGTDYPTTGHDKTCELWIVETARDSLGALVVEVERAQTSETLARAWLVERLVSDDEDPYEYTTTQLLDRLFSFGDDGWHRAGKAEEALAEARVEVERLTAELEGLKSKLGDGAAVSSGDGQLLPEARMLRALWDVFTIAGGDTNGDTGWHCSVEDACRAAIDTVRDLRSHHDLDFVMLLRLGDERDFLGEKVNHIAPLLADYEAAIRAYVSAWDANAACEDCADDDEFCEKHLEALHLSLKAATELVAGKSNPGDGEAVSSEDRPCEGELCPELLKERWESAGYTVRAARAEAALRDLANEAASAVCEPRRFHENENNRQQKLAQAVYRARATLVNENPGDSTAVRDSVEGREGMVTVYDHEGTYLGCMGIETWRAAITTTYETLRDRAGVGRGIVDYCNTVSTVAMSGESAERGYLVPSAIIDSLAHALAGFDLPTPTTSEPYSLPDSSPPASPLEGHETGQDKQVEREPQTSRLDCGCPRHEGHEVGCVHRYEDKQTGDDRSAVAGSGAGAEVALVDRIPSHHSRELPCYIEIDRQHYGIDSWFATGARLREIGGVPADKNLWRVGVGGEDSKVRDEESVSLIGGRFYSAPKFINAGAS